ncbi:hypothetical protein CDEST_11855 [Colletotrichum destructivum]|uniref:Uncharacterized protein n=1 Tax=Colletotrichum destructivum TaxID=34406 RepID=A0AAX4IUI6_9PEZI|nr:hypothetical protein CDEST_11855 [Colletotrichum destructivum]
MHVFSTIILAAAVAARVSALVVTNMPGHSRPSIFNLTNINVTKVIDTHPVMEARDESARDESTFDATGPEHEIEARDETAFGDIDTESTVKARSWSVTDEIDFEPGPQNGDEFHAQQRNEDASDAVEVAYHEIEPRRGSSNRFYNNRDQYSGSKSS